MELSIHAVRLRRADLETRMPFKYGIATMTALPHLFCEVDLTWQGTRQTGVSADHLAPKWFTKDPKRDPEDEVAEMIHVHRHAASVATGLKGSDVFTVWQDLHRQQEAWGDAQGYPPLLTHFGTALVERAIIDAVCRATHRPFQELLRANALGIDLGNLHAELAGASPADLLPREPVPAIQARHTVGLVDPLTQADGVDRPEAPQDGLPHTLEEVIHHYGVTHFKLKVGEDVDASLERLKGICRVVEQSVGPEARFTIDGNESWHTVDAFRTFWRAMLDEPDLALLKKGLLFLEQPFHRDIALGDDMQETLTAWEDRPPVIIDESDGDLDCLPRALDCGYVGTSHKNCKGVIHGVAGRCLLTHRQQASGREHLMSGEDLSNIGPVALPQDLAVQAALGNSSVERNGHHYFAGLSFWPQSIQKLMTTHHEDLYRPTDAGWPALAIRDGRLPLTSVNHAPFGLAALPDLAFLPEV
ncbi:MAG: enolase C-terminal domain-like protein [Opitutales bacterium]